VVTPILVQAIFFFQSSFTVDYLGSYLVAVLADKGTKSQVEILEKWLKGTLPTTIGISSLAVYAIRKGIEHGSEAVQSFVNSVWNGPLGRGLTTPGFGRNLDLIRGRFRNPACHGTGLFGVNDYEAFLDLLIANRRLLIWDTDGVTEYVDGLSTVPEWHGGVLHVQLAERLNLLGHAGLERFLDAQNQYMAEWEGMKSRARTATGHRWWQFWKWRQANDRS
jgi:hypothetical protein